MATDGSFDVACDVRFVQTQQVGQFTTGTGTIYSEDFYTVDSLPENVRVVTPFRYSAAIFCSDPSLVTFQISPLVLPHLRQSIASLPDSLNS